MEKIKGADKKNQGIITIILSFFQNWILTLNWISKIKK